MFCQRKTIQFPVEKPEHITVNVFEEWSAWVGDRVTQIRRKRKWRISNKNAKNKTKSSHKSPAWTLEKVRQ